MCAHEGVLHRPLPSCLSLLFHHQCPNQALVSIKSSGPDPLTWRRVSAQSLSRFILDLVAITLKHKKKDQYYGDLHHTVTHPSTILDISPSPNPSIYPHSEYSEPESFPSIISSSALISSFNITFSSFNQAISSLIAPFSPINPQFSHRSRSSAVGSICSGGSGGKRWPRLSVTGRGGVGGTPERPVLGNGASSSSGSLLEVKPAPVTMAGRKPASSAGA